MEYTSALFLYIHGLLRVQDHGLIIKIHYLILLPFYFKTVITCHSAFYFFSKQKSSTICQWYVVHNSI